MTQQQIQTMKKCALIQSMCSFCVHWQRGITRQKKVRGNVKSVEFRNVGVGEQEHNCSGLRQNFKFRNMELDYVYGALVFGAETKLQILKHGIGLRIRSTTVRG